MPTGPIRSRHDGAGQSLRNRMMTRADPRQVLVGPRSFLVHGFRDGVRSTPLLGRMASRNWVVPPQI